jgi:hypothetical protein
MPAKKAANRYGRKARDSATKLVERIDMNRSRWRVFGYSAVIVIVAAMCLISKANCSVESDPGIEPHRLSQAEIQRWLGAGYSAHKPIAFLSNWGVGICCDVGNTVLEFQPNQTIKIFIDGFAGTEASIPYRIQADGKIALASESQYPIPVLVNSKIHDVYMFRYASDTYVVSDSNEAPDFSDRKTWQWPWPFKFTAKGSGFGAISK